MLMNFKKYILFVSCFISLILTGPTSADEIILVNGDKISGTIIEKASGSIIVKTSYAGEVTIVWGQVAGITTTAPAVFKLTDETTIKGEALTTESGKIKIKSGEILVTEPIELGRIDAINPKKVEAQGVRLSGHVGAAANISDGNTRNKNYYFDAEIVARTDKNRYTMGGEFSQSEVEGEKTSEAWITYMKYDHFLTSHYYMYANSLFNKDKFKDLNLRSVIGLGLGYQVWESEKKNLSIELGFAYTNEDFLTTQDESYPAGRWALRYDRFIFNSPTQFFHNHEVLFGFEDIADLYFRSATGLRFPLVAKLNAVMQVNYDFDNTPANGYQRGDTQYRLGVSYNW